MSSIFHGVAEGVRDAILEYIASHEFELKPKISCRKNPSTYDDRYSTYTINIFPILEITITENNIQIHDCMPADLYANNTVVVPYCDPDFLSAAFAKLDILKDD